MKKFVATILALLFFMSCNSAFAKSDKNPSVKFNGQKYSLYYSAKSKELGSYINEYYKQREGYTNWTELVALHHYPNVKNPIKHAREFQAYLIARGAQVNIEADPENNSAIVDFVMTNNKRLPIIMEYNVFKFERSGVGGTCGYQYVRRYYVENPLLIDKYKEAIDKSSLKFIKAMNKAELPELVTENMEKGKFIIEDKISEVKPEVKSAVETKTVKKEENLKADDVSVQLDEDKTCDTKKSEIADEKMGVEEQRAPEIKDEILPDYMPETVMQQDFENYINYECVLPEKFPETIMQRDFEDFVL